ncbi:GntR family transcriptional regulator [Microbulbifer sp. S227A]|uniref:GntR family transcriptional regulator n=1 Tax=Microbulbifer sp. S227A TaxID=3415131 RepID=UPI003C7C30D2
MQLTRTISERRTTTDLVFERLHEEIVSLTLLPGTKLSEVEIAKRFGVSRQPVRDAFNKLRSQDLLLIRPQKATEVRGFSMERIAHERFVRLAVEVEVIRRACADWQAENSEVLAANLARQQDATENDQPETFHQLDYEFHKHICELSGHRLAFDTIQDCKQKIDRLCMLSLGRQSEIETLYRDHRDLAEALDTRNTDAATEIIRVHLARLDDTIADIHAKNQDYFE